MIQWIAEHRELCGILAGVLVNALALAYNVYRLVRAGGMKKLSDWMALADAARLFEAEAERFTAYTGAEKLNYVLSRLHTLAAEIGCPFDEERMIARIEADIAFTKEVNADKSETLE